MRNKNSWKPLISSCLEISRNASFIEAIYSLMQTSHTYVGKEASAIGLFHGDSAKLFFEYIYQDMKGGYNDNDLERIIFSIVNKIETEPVSNNFFDGIAGFGYSISLLNRINQFSLPIQELLVSIDAWLEEEIFTKLDQNPDFDFLYGLIGYGVYFLERLKSGSNYRLPVYKIFEALRSISNIYQGGLYWSSLKEPKTIELGVAHGQASILYFLCNVYRLNPSIVKKEFIISLIRTFSNQVDARGRIPDELNNNKKQFSPLRWCHGDLGISIILFQAGVILKDKFIIDFALKVAYRCSMEREASLPHLTTPCLCHGSLGVSHIFNRLYNYTSHLTFYKAARYWYEIGINQVEKGLSESCLQNSSPGLLEGIEGVGLALIAFQSRSTSPEWDSSLLLS